MATGRSPYLTRSRRRQQPPPPSAATGVASLPTSANGIPGIDTSSMDESHGSSSLSLSSSFASPTFRMGQSLVQARISPAAAMGTVSSHRPRRFFATSPRSSTAKSALSVKPTTNRLSLNGSIRRTLPTTTPGASSDGTKSSHSHQQQQQHPPKSILRPFPEGADSIIADENGADHNSHSHNLNDNLNDNDNNNVHAHIDDDEIGNEEVVIVDGMNLTQLRRLARTSLQGGHSTTAAPSIAVFYASLIYAKTMDASDAFLYAQALFQDGQAKRCVRLLEQSGLLFPNMHESMDLASGVALDQGGTCLQVHLLSLESVLLAAQALKLTEEWTVLLTLLEDATQPYSGAYDTSHANAKGNANGYANGRGNSVSFAAMHNANANANTTMINNRLEDDDDLAWNTWAALIRDAMPKGTIHPLARLCSERGLAYSETGHPLRAASYWKRSLHIDPKCVQALDHLLDRSIITANQTYQIITDLHFAPQEQWLRRMYLARIDLSPQEHLGKQLSTTLPDASSIHLTTPSFQQSTQRLSFGTVSSKSFFGDVPVEPATAQVGDDDNDQQKQQSNDVESDAVAAVPPIQRDVEDAFEKLWDEHKLQKSSHVLAMAARRSYKCYDLQDALRYCQELSAVDPLCQTAGFVYVCVCIALKRKRLLFKLAHEWVDASPKSARAWFAVGAYYYVCERYHAAQRHFCRATRLDPQCTAAWIAFGCAFAAVDESDQALASFRAAQRLSPGEHTSMLYIGMEYLRTNHLVLADHFLSAARTYSGGDPSCLNELGVLAYHQRDYATAIRWFCKALAAVNAATDSGSRDEPCDIITDAILLQELVENSNDVYWEPTLFNLAQSYRKLGYIDLSLVCLDQCLALNAESASTYSAIGFSKHLQYDLDGAIDYYHQALSRKPDDPFCTEMLHRALQDALHANPVVEQQQQQQTFVKTNGLQHKIASLELNSAATPKQEQSMMSEGNSLDTDMDMSMT